MNYYFVKNGNSFQKKNIILLPNKFNEILKREFCSLERLFLNFYFLRADWPDNRDFFATFYDLSAINLKKENFL